MYLKSSSLRTYLILSLFFLFFFSETFNGKCPIGGALKPDFENQLILNQMVFQLKLIDDIYMILKIVQKLLFSFFWFY